MNVLQGEFVTFLSKASKFLCLLNGSERSPSFLIDQLIAAASSASASASTTASTS